MQKTVHGSRNDESFFSIAWRGSRGPSSRFAAQMLKIMRLLTVFLFAASLAVSARPAAQTVSLSGTDLSLRKIFSEVKAQTGYFVFFNKDIIADAKPVSLDVTDMPLTDFLSLVFRHQGLAFRIDGRTIILSRQSPAGLLKEDDRINELAIAPPIAVHVTDSLGRPLSGATVAVKNSKTSGVTDANGLFTISADAGDILVISFVGYKTREVRVGGSSSINVSLSLADASMDDVVVNGIYERPVENYTGAANSFTEQQIRQVSNRNVFNAIRSMDPSFRMPDNFSLGSDPNHLPELQVRGANSRPNGVEVSSDKLNLRGDYIDNPNLPLFILDGFEVSLQHIYDLDLNRVERLTLLKDAAATAIYGSRAANGVVVIETKQPVKGKLQVTYNGNYTLTTPDLTSYDLLNAKEKLELELASGIYTFSHPAFQQVSMETYNRRLAEAERGVNTYWLSQPLRNSFGHKQSIFISGGDDYIRYGVDFSYNNDNNGVMKGSGRTNYSGGVNLSYRRKGLMVQNYFSAISNKAVRSPYGSFAAYAALNPYLRDRDSAGGIPNRRLSEKVGPGQPLPVVGYPDDKGNKQGFEKYRGKYLLIDFWASWCGSCRKPIPAIKKMYKEYNPLGLEIVSVSIDRSESAWRRAVKDENMPWEQLIASNQHAVT